MRFRSTQFRYALTYVFVTFFVLFFLNVYCSGISQKLFYKNKESSMIERSLITAAEIADLEVINNVTISNALSEIGTPKATRLLIVDQNCQILYDSEETINDVGKYYILPEIIKALEGNDVFTWQYKSGVMQSRSATPIISYGITLGCVYMMEYDTEQGALIQTLQRNILTITLILEVAVFLFAIIFSTLFSKRLRKIMASIRIIREGDYTHKVQMRGRDELTMLGEEFNDLAEKLQMSEQKRRQFVSDASHELKTPLASIKLLTDSILQNEMDQEMVHEFVGDIGNEAERLNRMSQKLLSLSKIESQSDSDCEIVYIAPTVHRVIRMINEIAKEHQITIQTELNNDCTILIIEDDLYQIIFNLIENGIKYNIAGGTLSITLRREDDNAVLVISDTGVGIPEDSLEHIFERFYRVDKARSRKSGGSGLGLSIVKNMVERNRGTIHVTSTVGAGTTFTLSFPVFDTEDDL